MKPDDVKKLRIIDLQKLREEELTELELGYESLLKGGNKAKLDSTVFKILEMDNREATEVLKKLSELQNLSVETKG